MKQTSQIHSKTEKKMQKGIQYSMKSAHLGT